MPALTPGAIAPQFELKDTSGKTVSLGEVLKNGPVVVAFFKVACPTCQLTFPFLQRMFESYGTPNLAFLGVSQNSPAETRAFMERFGTRFPVLIEERGYATSNAYGLTNVPTIFWINPDRKIHLSSVGFSKNDLERIFSEASAAAGEQPSPLFRPGEKVPDFKPG
ncbi:MAG TPA: TlpA disulfide reductase family protein [Candidatus Dormibacteraeota bacterium]|nr:TlpA disulfide reductase family protein [Candidatus Dormibacteraeota bacterium]